VYRFGGAHQRSRIGLAQQRQDTEDLCPGRRIVEVEHAPRRDTMLSQQLRRAPAFRTARVTLVADDRAHLDGPGE